MNLKETMQSDAQSPEQEMISELSSQISMLKNRISEMQSKHQLAIAEMAEELLSLQKVNQSLTKRNEVLRNNYGFMNWKEQQKLEDKCHALEVTVADLRKKAMKSIESANSRQRIAWGCLLFTLICCLLRNQTFISDILDFLIIPFNWIIHNLAIYFDWMNAPYYTRQKDVIHFSTGWAWSMRILSVLLLIAAAFALGIGICWLLDKYRKRWCNLSLKVLLGTLATITSFGDIIRAYTHINLVLTIILSQLLYLGSLLYLDGYYEARYRLDEWEKIQKK